MKLLKPRTSLIIIASFVALGTTANAQTFTSTDKRTSLVELYTSEGCSSCPPADRWLNSLRDNNKLWSEFIPLAFHVDYWDYIGWQDPFASKAYSQRQYLYASQKNIRSVYTPGIVLNGEEWRGWSHSRRPKYDSSPAGKLSIEIEQGKFNANYIPLSHSKFKPEQKFTLNIALLGFDQISEVAAGENGGKTFKHDFVVLAYRTVEMKSTNSGFIVDLTPLPNHSHSTKIKAVATWVNEKSNLTPLQATGGWLMK